MLTRPYNEHWVSPILCFRERKVGFAGEYIIYFIIMLPKEFERAYYSRSFVCHMHMYETSILDTYMYMYSKCKCRLHTE